LKIYNENAPSRPQTSIILLGSAGDTFKSLGLLAKNILKEIRVSKKILQDIWKIRKR